MMNNISITNQGRVSCKNCPLHGIGKFREFDAGELAFVSKMKAGEFNVDPGASILLEGSHSAHLFTQLSGWGFRYKILEDGRRQILNYTLPGDLIGLQGSLLGEMQHSVETLTAVTYCVFERSRLMELYQNYPNLAYDITWMAAREERILDEHLLSIGRRTALERAAYLLAFLHERAVNTGVVKEGSRSIIPVSQTHVADTLGLSIVHTNKTLKKLADRKMIKWMDRACEVRDPEGLADIAGWAGMTEEVRPYL